MTDRRTVTIVVSVYLSLYAANEQTEGKEDLFNPN